MNEGTWTDPGPIHGCPGGKRIRFIMGKAEIGWVSWYMPNGPFYPVTQVRRFGPIANISRARHLVEANALFDVLTYPTRGNA